MWDHSEAAQDKIRSLIIGRTDNRPPLTYTAAGTPDLAALPPTMKDLVLLDIKEYMRENIGKVEIFYSDLNIQQIYTQPSYGVSEFFFNLTQR